jgi:transposase
MRALPDCSSRAIPHQPDRAGMIEIELPGGARVRVDAFVNDKALSRVFRALKGMA